MKWADVGSGGGRAALQLLPTPAGARRGGPLLSHRMYLFISFRKSAPPQNHQLSVYYYLLKHKVDEQFFKTN